VFEKARRIAVPNTLRVAVPLEMDMVIAMLSDLGCLIGQPLSTYYIDGSVNIKF
jgi:hypothetical protein